MKTATAVKWIISLLALAGCGRSDATSRDAIRVRLSSPGGNAEDQRVFDLGDHVAGRSITRALILHNTAAETKEITRWTTSCECVQLPACPLAIPPGCDCQIDLVVEGESLTNFHGGLAIEIAGFQADQRIVTIELRLNIAGASDGAPSGALEPVPATDDE